MRIRRLALLLGPPLLLCVAAMPSIAQAPTDACKLLTAGQVSAAIGVPVGAGTHVTPTFVKTCTWNVSRQSDVKTVTLYLQKGAAYDGGKRMASQMAPLVKDASVTSAGIGDDAYYFVEGELVGLLVKKGNVSFKVTVYATLPANKKEPMELILAKDVLAKL